MLTPVLEKQIITKAKSKYINLSDKLCEFNEDFTMYLTTRLPNPHFSPEDQAKTTVVDFTVTQKGLEEQLLGVVIQKEQVISISEPRPLHQPRQYRPSTFTIHSPLPSFTTSLHSILVTSVHLKSS